MSDKREATGMKAQQGTVRPHQPGQDVFRSVLSEDIDWKPFAAFPPSVRLAVVVGRPSEAGPYTIRVRVPHGVKIMPHRHPEDRVYTVMSGVFYIGLGDQFDADKLQAYPPGSVIVLPGNTSHFHWAKSSEYITQVTAIGPLGLEYISPKDDPRNDIHSAESSRSPDLRCNGPEDSIIMICEGNLQSPGQTLTLNTPGVAPKMYLTLSRAFCESFAIGYSISHHSRPCTPLSSLSLSHHPTGWEPLF